MGKGSGRWKKVIGRTVLLAFGTIISLALLELATRVVYSRQGMDFGIEMWKYAKILKKRSPNPAMGHEHVPNRQAFLMGAQVAISPQGLRDRDYPMDRDATAYRVLVLGDSTTFGWGVAQEKTYPKVLEQMLNDRPPAGKWRHFEVINTGIGNYNTSQEVAYFHDRGYRFQPDMVLLGFFINDAEETPRPAGNWVSRESCFYTFLTSVGDVFLRRMNWRPGYRDYYSALYEEGQPGWVECQRALKDLADTCRGQRIALHVLIIPELHHLGSAYEFRDVHDKVKRILAAQGVPVIDLLDSFPADHPETFWVSLGDPHPNEKACQIIAQRLYADLWPAKSKAATPKPEGPHPGG
jgi:lysophospholipase L1-like esterase